MRTPAGETVQHKTVSQSPGGFCILHIPNNWIWTSLEPILGNPLFEADDPKSKSKNKTKATTAAKKTVKGSAKVYAMTSKVCAMKSKDKKTVKGSAKDSNAKKSPSWKDEVPKETGEVAVPKGTAKCSAWKLDHTSMYSKACTLFKQRCRNRHTPMGHKALANKLRQPN